MIDLNKIKSIANSCDSGLLIENVGSTYRIELTLKNKKKIQIESVGYMATVSTLDKGLFKGEEVIGYAKSFNSIVNQEPLFDFIHKVIEFLS